MSIETTFRGPALEDTSKVIVTSDLNRLAQIYTIVDTYNRGKYEPEQVVCAVTQKNESLDLALANGWENIDIVMQLLAGADILPVVAMVFKNLRHPEISKMFSHDKLGKLVTINNIPFAQTLIREIGNRNNTVSKLESHRTLEAAYSASDARHGIKQT